MKAIKKIAAAASRLWGRFHFKRSLLALRSEGRRAAYRRLFIIGSILLVVALVVLLPILSVSSAQVELLALKKSSDLGGPCHEACRQERLVRRQKIVGSLLDDDKLLLNIASYFQINNSSNSELAVDFYQELLSIINLAYGTKEPPSFLIDYLAEPAGRDEVKALIIRLVLSRVAEPELADYYLAILEGSASRILKEEAIRSLNVFPASSDFLQVQHVDRLANLIMSSETEDLLKPSLIFLLGRYYHNFPEEVVLKVDKLYLESSEPVIKLLVADLMASWGMTGYAYPEVSDSQWQKYFN